MKVGDGIVQARRGQIGEQALEMAECFGGLISLCGRFNDVVRAGMLDEAVGAPVVAEGSVCQARESREGMRVRVRR